MTALSQDVEEDTESTIIVHLQYTSVVSDLKILDTVVISLICALTSNSESGVKGEIPKISVKDYVSQYPLIATKRFFNKWCET